MDFWNVHLINWRMFFFVLILLIALMLLYRSILKRILGNYLSDAHGKQLDPRFIYIQRILVMLWVILLVFAFIMVSPFIHGGITLILISLTYQYLSNFVQGTFLIKELNLIKGMKFSIGENSGLIDKLSTTGLFLAISDKSFFVPYNKLMEKMGATYQNVISSKLKLICSIQENEDIEKSKEKLKRKLFMSPFINDSIKPQIEAKGDQIEISLQVKNPEYIPNIIQSIEKAGFSIRKEDN